MTWRTLPVLILAHLALAVEPAGVGPQAPSPPPGVRIFACTHSFGVYVPEFLKEVADRTGIAGQKIVGLSRIAGSTVIQHWEVPEAQNKAKRALAAGEVDVLTLTPILAPDEGVRRFAVFANQHRADIRIAMQESWGPFFTPWSFWIPKEQQECAWWKTRNDATLAGLLERSAAPLRALDDLAMAINKELGRPIISIIPAAHAVMALRGRVHDGGIPGITDQNTLFTDQLGHPGRVLRCLVGYCHYAVIYRCCPIGLPVPKWLEDRADAVALNGTLQEIAWQAVIAHPLSGVAPTVAERR